MGGAFSTQAKKNWKFIHNLSRNKKFWEELIAYFPCVSHLFEVPEPNLMELNLIELTLISFNSI
jgi:hypothetical protein